MPTRRQFLSGAASAAATASKMAAQARPKNIMLMIADDLGLHTGAYGDRTAVTPNLDRMAAEGVRFANGFCTTASCSASRSVILSGLHNHANGQYGHAHAEHHFGYLPFVRPLPDLLKDAGYITGYVGKLHVNPIERFRWNLDAPEETRNVATMAKTARKFIQDAGSRPWYLHVGFGDPHRAGTGFANRDYPGVQRRRFDPNRMETPSFLPQNGETRAELSQYYEAANRMDQGVGFLFDILRETGQLENTLVAFISDNGMPFPNAKTCVYESGMHLPMIVRSPTQTRRGLVNNAMVSWTDLVPLSSNGVERVDRSTRCMAEAGCRSSNRKTRPVGTRSTFRTPFTRSPCTIRCAACARANTNTSAIFIRRSSSRTPATCGTRAPGRA